MKEERQQILQEIHEERERQDAKWGEQNHPVTTETRRKSCANTASYFKAMCDLATQRREVTWADIILEEVFEALSEEDPDKQIEELTQVAAVAVSMMECIKRNRKRGEK